MDGVERRSALVVYATSEGHTAEVAGRVGERLRAAGLDVRLTPVDTAPDEVAAHDLVVVGASIHLGKYQHEVVEWVRRHLERLDAGPAAFFSVSLTSAQHTPEADAQVEEYLHTFAEQSGWSPQLIGLFGGALAYTQYGFFKKRLVRSIAKQHGQGTDVHRDYDYTDWDDVDHFGDRCAELVTA